MHARRCRQPLRVRPADRDDAPPGQPDGAANGRARHRASGPTARSTSRCRSSTAGSTSARSLRGQRSAGDRRGQLPGSALVPRRASRPGEGRAARPHQQLLGPARPGDGREAAAHLRPGRETATSTATTSTRTAPRTSAASTTGTSAARSSSTTTATSTAATRRARSGSTTSPKDRIFDLEHVRLPIINQSRTMANPMLDRKAQWRIIEWDPSTRPPTASSAAATCSSSTTPREGPEGAVTPLAQIAPRVPRWRPDEPALRHRCSMTLSQKERQASTTSRSSRRLRLGPCPSTS